ncbi:hypothetical protein F0562_013586 [Nyssa sinensis]|uniref:Uncharacterized protein n=1 Tax=Nyssa sinensis TaxID=561372 RepID=A0A5J4ZL37_9ASTE|nr:hypothetical protein F0562_013586 [Nyssa sinensis]
MRSKANKQSKLRQYIGAPARFLSKARDFYVQSMVCFDGRVGYGNMMGCPAPQMANLPKNFGASSSKKANEELFRTVSMRNSRSVDARRQQVVAPNGVGRSYSVGLGRIGTIDEDKPCDFVEEEFVMKTDFLFPRSRSYAVAKRNVGLKELN